MPVTLQPTTLKYKNSGGTFQTADCLSGATYTPAVSENGVLSWTNNGGLANPAAVNLTLPTVVEVTGSTPIITGVANHIYKCGEVSTISITPPAQGIIDVIFTSGTSIAVLTLPSSVKMPDWFEVEANMIYEINILDGVYGSVASWPNS